MKVITVHGVWAPAFAGLDKRVENRTWKPNLAKHERFAIHAGQHLGAKAGKDADHKAIELMTVAAQQAGWRGPDLKQSSELPVVYFRGSAIGLDDVLVDWNAVPLGCVFAIASFDFVAKTKKGEAPPPWGIAGQYHWHLSELILVPEPVPCKGQQRLRSMPADVERTVLDQVL